MQPSLPIGTVLQNRYRLLKLLGQGGFGRTYLAEDLGRFNERCALKELMPIQTGTYSLEKSKELFQREANILYQIQHPQIPQFRATVEQDQRLFLVQDYVEGKTYRTLLSERKSQGQRFSEAEVLQLLQQMLPVLDHIHSKGIVHRDISPDNIILRDRDRVPILIDFGGVKELVTRLQSPGTLPATTVGKMGYAPPEQIQTGRAYPNSDLYALAVTCIVLLTGQEPQDLYDETTLSWTWHRWIPPVNPGLTQVLNRMLSYKPSDRFQNAWEVALTLKSLYSNPGLQSVSSSQPRTQATEVKTLPTPKVSQMRTVAVGRNPQPTYQSQYPSEEPNPVIPVETQRSSWDNPVFVVFIGMCLAILAGVGSWALVSTILNRQLQVQTFPKPAATVFDSPTDSVSPTPTPTETETPTPTPTPTPDEPVTTNQRVNPELDESLTIPGTLKANTTVNYILTAEQGQKLNASVTEEGVLMTVLRSNEQPVNDQAKRVKSWEGELPASGDYVIELRTVKGVQESPYTLTLRLSQPETETTTPTPTPTPTTTSTTTPTATPTPTPSESPSPENEFKVLPSPNAEYDVEPLDFPEGNSSGQFSGLTKPDRPKRYLVYAKAGQVLSVRLQSGTATLDIRNPDGQALDNASGLGEWEGKVDQSGEYQIDVKASKETDFTLEVGVRQ